MTLLNCLKVLFLILVMQSNICPQAFTAQSKEIWESTYKKSLTIIRENNLAEAEILLKQLLENHQDIPQIHYALGLLYNKKEPGCREAEKYFEKAIDLDKNFAEAWYGLGIVHQNQKNQLLKARQDFYRAVNINPMLTTAWFKLGKVESELNQTGAAIETYSEAVLLNPENEKVYQTFLDFAHWQKAEKKGLRTIERLIQIYPANFKYLLDKAGFLYRMDKFEESVKVLKKYERKFPENKSTGFHLLKAKLNFAMDKPEIAEANYWQAVNSIRDSLDANLIFKDVCYIMNDDEYELLLNTLPDSLNLFYERFWRKRDPNLATLENERIPEHFKRLEYASKNFRRYLVGESTQMEYLYKTFHRFHFYNHQGDEFLSMAEKPKAIPLARNIDDMGLIYIRHGEPDIKITALNSTVDGNVQYVGNDAAVLEPNNNFFLKDGFRPGFNWSWKYFESETRTSMIFHFKKFGGELGWIIESIPFNYTDREILHPIYRELKIISDTHLGASHYFDICEMINRMCLEDLREGVTTETNNYKFKSEPLEIPFHLITFKENDYLNLLEIYYMIEGSSTMIEESDTGQNLNIEKFIIVCDSIWDEKYRIDKNEKIPIQVSQSAWDSLSIIDVERIKLLPGKYNVEFHLRDGVSQKTGVYRFVYNSVNFNADSLFLSDIILSSEITPAMTQIKFRKEFIAYNPHMFQAFEQGEQVGIYFEIYNLKQNAVGETNFRVTCTLQPADNPDLGKKILAGISTIFGREPNIVGSSYEYSGQTADDKIYLNFDLEEDIEGEYELVVEVEDLNSNKNRSKKIPLTIHKNNPKE